MTRSFYASCCLRFLAQTIVLGSLGIWLTACGGPIHVTSSPQSTRITITPSSSTLSVGQTLQLTASAAYPDGTSKDQTTQARWTSSNASVGSVSSTGLLRAKAVGTASISASINGLTISINVNVNTAVPQSIAIAPTQLALTVGQKAQLTATATLTDGTSQDVTHTVSWNISDPSVIGIDSTGLASALKAGTSALSASLTGSGSGKIAGSSTATVAPELLSVLQISGHDASMALGTSQQLTAVGTYNDGAVRDLTAAVSWSSSASSIVSVSATGEAIALTRGSAALAAVAGGVTTAMTVNVTDPVLSSIAIAPSDADLLAGKNVKLSAIGTYTNGSTSDLSSVVTWTVDNPRILEIDKLGNAIAFSPGTAAVEASLGGTAGKSNVTVRPVALVSYFSGASSKADTTVRMVGMVGSDPEICTMVYVFNQDQQMSECCGCQISREGIRNLSLQHDLLSNPLTGIAPETGTLMLVTAASNGSTPCNPAEISPAGSGDAWATHLQNADSPLTATTETPFTKTELGDTLLANLQAQCSFIQTLGSGQGVCGCGTGN